MPAGLRQLLPVQLGLENFCKCGAGNCPCFLVKFMSVHQGQVLSYWHSFSGNLQPPPLSGAQLGYPEIPGRAATDWDKLWKSRRSSLEKFALGKSQGKSDFPEGRSPEGKSDYPRDFPWANFQTTPKAFPQLVRLKASKTEENVSRRSSLNIFRVCRRTV